MSNEVIDYDVDQGVATLSLKRPDKLNAFTSQMVEEAGRALKAAARDPEVRCLVLTGRGRGFSAGQDLVEAAGIMGNPEASIGEHLRQTYHVLINRLLDLEMPVLGLINGVTAGIGLSFALATDLRIASDRASFVLGFHRIGLIPDGGANWVLPRLIGYGRAFEMAVTRDRVTADQALAWGLVNRVVPHEQLEEIGLAYARSLAAGPTLAYGLTKRAMRQGMTQSLAENMELEAHLQEVTGRSEDCREGVMAFLEKRSPAYQGR